MSDILALAAAITAHAEAINRLAGAVSAQSADETPKAESPAPVRQSRRNAARAEEPKGEPPAPPADEPEDEPTTLTYDADVKPLVVKVNKEKGREALNELFGRFKGADGKPVDHGTKIQAKDFQAFIDAAGLVLEPGEEDVA